MGNLWKVSVFPLLSLLVFTSVGVLAQKGGTGSDIAGGQPPAAPTNLKADGSIAPREVVLTWTSSGGTGFVVLRSLSSNGTFSQIATPSATTYTDSGLSNGTTYYYEVEATNGYGTSGPSNQASAITKPAAPNGLSANGGTAPKTVVLSWTGSATATSYNVLRSGSSGGPFSGIGSSSTTSYSDTTANPGTTYFYEIAGVNASGPGADSGTASALTLPAAPALTATGGDTVVSLSWSWVQSETGYIVTRSNTLNGQPTATFTMGSGDTSLIDDGLANGNTFYYKIYATNMTGNGPASSASAQVAGTIPISGGGLTAEYAHYNNQRVTENDSIVDSTQIAIPPAGISPTQNGNPPNGPPDSWSCRWSGHLTAPVTGTYWFWQTGGWQGYVEVDGVSVQPDWNQYAPGGIPQPSQYSVNLAAGQTYPVVIEISNDAPTNPPAPVQFQWELPGNESYEAIPANYLSPAVGELSTPNTLTAAESGSQVSLSWTDNQSTGCDLYRAVTSGGEDYSAGALNGSPVQPSPPGGSAYAYSDSGVQSGQLYFYTSRTEYSNPVTGDYTFGTPSAEDDNLTQTQLTAVYSADDLIVGSSGSTTATVSLANVLPASASVGLRSTDPRVSVPATVTIPAGSLSASFQISARNSGADYTAQVVASCGGWVQKCNISSVTNVTDCAIANVGAVAGDGSVMISWEPPQSTSLGNYVLGYEVYRIIGSNKTLLSAGPIRTCSYMDTDPVVGEPATYEVDLVASDGSALSSGTDQVTATSGSGSLSWETTPWAWSGVVYMTAVNPSPSVTWVGELFVDGVLSGPAVSGGGSQALGSIYAGLDTSSLSNGPHTLWIASQGNPLQTTPPLLINVSNGPILHAQAELELDAGETAMFSEPLTSGDQWVATLTGPGGGAVREWTATGALQFAWDGLDTSGNEVPDADYTLTVASTGTSGVLTRTASTSKLHVAPSFLALCMGNTKNGSETPAPNDVTYASDLKSYLAARKGSIPAFYFYVAFQPVYCEADPQLVQDIRKWLGPVLPNSPGSGSVQFFYLYGHGSTPDATGEQFGTFGASRISNYNYYLYSKKKGYVLADTVFPNDFLSIPYIVGPSRTFTFAWIDICGSAGETVGGPDDNMTASPNTLWATVFNINLWGGNGAVMLWNGYMLLNQWDGGPYQWQRYRNAFWYSISGGNSVLNSVTYAIEHCDAEDEEISPLDYQWFGSTEQFKLYNWGDVSSIP